ncbi:MAG: hypothetical protein WAU88_07675 [Candidatus Zixiibacteriota bacterium]
MQGIVLDFTPNQIYLEIDKQVRFRSRWIAEEPLTSLHVRDRIEFKIQIDHGEPQVIVHAIQSAARQDRSGNSSL